MKNFVEMDSPYAGYSDATLEKLSRLHGRSEAGLVPWLAWEPENSSFGRTLRHWTGFPGWLPLCIGSDHGVHWGATCWPNEVSNPFGTFFTWNEKKSQKMQSLMGKDAYYVPHPWLKYRQDFYPTLPSDRRGTLVFYSHSNNTTTPVFNALDEYMASLLALPEKFHPIVICLSFHDIRKGLHKKLRAYGIPLVTAGTTNSKYFVDRFYQLVRRFSYSCSPNIGSHTFYLLEAGVPFFLFGPPPEYIIKGSKAVKDGTMNIADYGDDEDRTRLESFKILLQEPVDAVTDPQRAVATEYLGGSSPMTGRSVLRVLWKSFFCNIFQVFWLYMQKIWDSLLRSSK